MKKYIFVAISLVVCCVYAHGYTTVVGTCLDSLIVLEPRCNAGKIEWSTGDTSPTYWYHANSVGEETIIAHRYVMVEDTTAENLLINGGFEKGYVGFTSDYYLPIDQNGDTVIDPYNAAVTYFGGNYGEHYAIVKDAKRYNQEFFPISAKSGAYFGLFDTPKDPNNHNRRAWIASSVDNPDLKVTAKQQYIFSFFATTPNQYGTEATRPNPQLRVDILYKTENGWQADYSSVEKETYIEVVRGNDTNNVWQKHSLVWTPNRTSDSVRIMISNEEESREGNDFCLDDIEFKEKRADQPKLDCIDTFVVSIKDCDSCQYVYTKRDVMLVVDNTTKEFVSYQWYRNGVLIEGATKQYYFRDPSKDDDNTIYHVVATRADGTTYTSCRATLDLLPRTIDKVVPERREIGRRVFHQGVNLSIIEIFYDDGTSAVQKVLEL